MTDSQLLVLGASLALVGSIVGHFFAGLWNYYFENRRIDQEKRRNSLALLGRQFGFRTLHKENRGEPEFSQDWEEAMADVNFFAKESKQGHMHDFVSGYMEVLANEMERLYLEGEALRNELSRIRNNQSGEEEE